MSQPGHWKTAGGTEVLIKDMTDSHLKNSMRLMVKRYDDNVVLPTDGPVMTKQKTSSRKYYWDKLCDLAEEAQRRGIVAAGDITDEQVADLVRTWKASRDAGATPLPQTVYPAPSVNYFPNSVSSVISPFAVAVAAKAPPQRIGLYLDVILEVEQVIAMPIFGLGREDNIPDRRIEMDL